ncbi:MAG: hypothetical protein HKP16_04305 [Xanthomonadales bacterium]|nr:hypothetical protein [Xanthomonadales bacterium]
MRSLRAISLLGLLMVSACVSTSPPIPPNSLGAFRDTLVQLNQKSTEALTAEYEWNYRNYKRAVREDEDLDPRTLALEFCLDSAFHAAWGSCDVDADTSPVFMVIADSRRDLGKLNQMMVDYANFLMLFNSANSDTRAALEDAAVRIGDSAQSIAANAGLSLNEARFGAFAKIGVGIVDQLLAKKQRDGMAAVLADFQPGVQAFAELGSEAMQISAGGVQTEYQTEVQPLKRAIVQEQDSSRRLKLVEDMIALNEQTARQLDVLGSLAAVYGSLPGAHAELMSALQSGYRASLNELVASIEAVSSAYQTLHASQSN